MNRGGNPSDIPKMTGPELAANLKFYQSFDVLIAQQFQDEIDRRKQ